MFHLHLRSCHALMLGALSLGVALAACEPAGTAVTTPVAAGASATPAAVDATAMPSVTAASPSVAALLATAPATPIASAPPTPTLAVPTVLATAPPLAFVPKLDQLPADQPWLLVHDGPRLCGALNGDLSLSAIDHAGKQTRFNRGVTAIAERPGMPPLLATCAADGSVAIVDPLDWSSVPLTLEPGFVVTQIAPSPDGKQAVLLIWCYQGSPCLQGSTSWDVIADLQTGATRPAFLLGGPPQNDGPYTTELVSVGLLGWGSKGLYYVSIRRRAGHTTLDLVDPAHPQTSSQRLVDDYNYVLDSVHEQLIRSSFNTSFTLSDVRQGSTQMIEQAEWVSSPTFAPDGAALAYFRAAPRIPSSETHGQELVVFDSMRNIKTVLINALIPADEWQYSDYLYPAIVWSQDGQRIILGTKSPHAALLTRDGVLLNTVPMPAASEALPYSDVMGITSDDQLVLDLHDSEHRHVLSWLPLRAGARPYAANARMGGRIYVAMLPPLSASAPPVAPASDVTTPRTATLVPISKLGDVPSDSQLSSKLPVYDHAIYDLRGSLYSQALRAGSAALLGLGDPVALSPDRKMLIFQRPDGLYRVPVDGGAAVRLTPALPTATTGIAGTRVSPDGRQLVYALIGPKPTSLQNQLDEPWIVALYSVPIANGAPVRLTPPLDPGSSIAIIGLSADSRYVIYKVDVPDTDALASEAQIILRSGGLYSVPITGGTARRLVGVENTIVPVATLGVPDTNPPLWKIRLSGDGQYLLYQYMGRSENALWSVAVAGGSPVPIATPGGVEGDYQISADNQSLLYQNQAGIYVASITRGTVVTLTSSLKPEEKLYRAQFTPNGRQVVFRTSSALYRVPISGGPAISLSSYTSAAEVTSFDIHATNQRMIYQNGNAIFSLALAGGRPIQLTPAVDQAATLHLDQLSPDARYLIYTIEREAGRTRAIYSVPVGGGSPKLLFSGLSVVTALYTFSGGYAIGMDSGLLYAAPLTGGRALQLSALPVTSEWPVISADGRHVIYVAHHPAGTPGSDRALYVATLP